MDEKLKNKWVKALRSGKYMQVQENLRGEIYDPNEANKDGVGFCCLGVLCEVTPGIEFKEDQGRYVVTSKKLSKLFKDEDKDDSWMKDSDGSVIIEHESIPAPLAKHFGLTKRVVHNGVRKDLQSKLIDMNDFDSNFEQIANYVERVL